jgi:hypothetical protein
MDSAQFRVIGDIENYNRLGGIKKQLADTGMQIFMINQISARQSDAIMALVRLQFRGITENQILNACRRIEMTGHNPNGVTSSNPIF